MNILFLELTAGGEREKRRHLIPSFPLSGAMPHTIGRTQPRPAPDPALPGKGGTLPRASYFATGRMCHGVRSRSKGLFDSGLCVRRPLECTGPAPMCALTGRVGTCDACFALFADPVGRITIGVVALPGPTRMSTFRPAVPGCPEMTLPTDLPRCRPSILTDSLRAGACC